MNISNIMPIPTQSSTQQSTQQHSLDFFGRSVSPPGLDRPLKPGMSKTTENNYAYLNPLLSNAMHELYRLTRPVVTLHSEQIKFAKCELRECKKHGHPNVHVRVHHNNLNDEPHGTRYVCLCLNCLIANSSSKLWL